MVRMDTRIPRPVIYSLSLSLDGYITGPDGGFDWSAPDEELFRFSIDEIRGVSAHLLGRRLYETMLYWNEPDSSWGDAEREFATIWRDLPKIVFSRTLTAVTGANTRLATGTVEEEIALLRAEPASGAIAVGGADLAHSVIDAGLVDEYRMRFHPVLVGGGVPFFSHAGQRADLELIGGRQFAGGVVYAAYRMRRLT